MKIDFYSSRQEGQKSSPKGAFMKKGMFLSSEDALKWWRSAKEMVEEVRVQRSNHAQGLRTHEEVILQDISDGQLRRLKAEDLRGWHLVESGLGRVAHLAQQRWKKEVGKHHIAFVKEAAKAFLKKKMYVTPQKASG